MSVKINGWLKEAILRPMYRKFHKHNYRVVETLPAYVPFSAGSVSDKASMTLQAAQQTLPFFVKAVETAQDRSLLQPILVDDYDKTTAGREAAARLKTYLDEEGSDKADRHNYHLIYGPILSQLTKTPRLLEVGLGTNNTDVVSNMGAFGRPGASLRAFSKMLPDAKVYGADIDKRILFQEVQIETFFVDQTDLSTFENLKHSTSGGLDFILDDGLHSPNANLATLIFALETLNTNGYYICEDISFATIELWQLVAATMPDRFVCQLVETRNSLVFILFKKE